MGRRKTRTWIAIWNSTVVLAEIRAYNAFDAKELAVALAEDRGFDNPKKILMAPVDVAPKYNITKDHIKFRLGDKVRMPDPDPDLMDVYPAAFIGTVTGVNYRWDGNGVNVNSPEGKNYPIDGRRLKKI